MKRKWTKTRVFGMIAALVSQVVFLIPWVPNGEGHEIFQVHMLRAFQSGDAFTYLQNALYAVAEFEGFSQTEISGMLFADVAAFVFILIAQFFSILYLLSLFLGREKLFLYIPVFFASTGALMTAVSGGTADTYMYTIGDSRGLIFFMANLAMAAITFVGGRMMDSWDETKKENEERRKREQLRKKERKERLYFPGKYSPLFYTVIRRNFWYRFADYRMFLVVSSLSISFIFAGNGMNEMLKGQNVGSTLFNFLIVAMAMAAFLIISVLLHYLKNNMKNYSMFLNLGMRRETLFWYVGIELVSCIVLSFFFSALLGNGILFLCRIMMGRVMAGGISLGNVTVKTYLLTYLCAFGIYVVALMATHDIYFGSGLAGSDDKAVRSERLPGFQNMFLIVLGAVISAVSAGLFMKRELAEQILLLGTFFVGLYLILKNGWGILLGIQKKNINRYYSKLMNKNFLYYRFRTNFRYIFFLGVLHISVLFVFAKEVTSVSIAEEPESLFPYDYVCMATDEDKDIFEKLKESCGAEVHIYPMVRATSLDSTERLENDYRSPIYPEGQNIGISESVYRELCDAKGVEPKELDLSSDGEKIYILYQQDKSIKAQPIDYYMARLAPHIHIGQPLPKHSYLERDTTFPIREVAEENVGVLTGALRQGKHENIIVFADEYVEQVKDNWQKEYYLNGEKLSELGMEPMEGVTTHHWPDRLVLMNVDKEQKAYADELLAEFKSRHKLDEWFDKDVLSYYDKEELIQHTKAERAMKMAVNLFIMCIMLLTGFLLLYLKAEGEMTARQKKHEFLTCMGMRQEERLRTLRSELRSFLWIPVIVSTVSAVFFTTVIWNLRQYSLTDCIRYLKVWGILYLCYILLQILGVKGLEYYIIRKVEKEWRKK